MSTHAVVLVKSRFELYDWRSGDADERVRDIARVYRGCDGYPDANGLDIIKALASAAFYDAEKLNNRNWAQHFLKRYLATDANMELEVPCGDGASSWGDLSYIYEVEGRSQMLGLESSPDEMDEVVVRCFDAYGREDLASDYGDVRGKCRMLYEGGWRGYLPWLRRFCGDGSCPLDSDYSEESWHCRGCGEDVWKGMQLLSRPGGAGSGSKEHPLGAFGR